MIEAMLMMSCAVIGVVVAAFAMESGRTGRDGGGRSAGPRSGTRPVRPASLKAAPTPRPTARPTTVPQPAPRPAPKVPPVARSPHVAQPQHQSGASRPLGSPGAIRDDLIAIVGSARKMGQAICFSVFHEHLARELGATHLHAVCTHDPHGCLPVTQIEASPWQLHTREVSWVQRDGEWVRQANSDTVFAALAGSLAAQLQPHGLLLLTGDGGLACDTAKVIRAVSPNPPRIIAMGIAGSVSRRLTEGQSPDIGFGGYLATEAFADCISSCCNKSKAG